MTAIQNPEIVSGPTVDQFSRLLDSARSHGDGSALPRGVISRETLLRTVPSAFAESPWHGMSSRYKFVPTITMINWLADLGFMPVRAEQSRTRIAGKGDFTRHMIRLRHSDLLNADPSTRRVGQEFPEIVMTNSHDGTSGVQMSAGIFRLVCLNGMVAASGSLGEIRVRHTGGADYHAQLAEAANGIAGNFPRMLEQVESWKQLELPAPVATAFAKSALEVVDSVVKPSTDRLLSARRREDMDPTLWSILNRVQENLLKGGVRGTSGNTGQTRNTKAIKSVAEDVRINRALWTLADEMAKLVG